ncbi:MAG: hypothetical protein KTR30_07860 [Saprospiraceae bacterium]|nr:hypothetical protein [Saprospiraceae bacterium]
MKSRVLLLLFLIPAFACQRDKNQVQFTAGDWDLAFSLDYADIRIPAILYFKDHHLLPLSSDQEKAVWALFNQQFPQKSFLNLRSIDGYLYQEEEQDPITLTVRLIGETDSGQTVPLAIEFQNSFHFEELPSNKQAYQVYPEYLHTCSPSATCQHCSIPLPKAGSIKAKVIGCGCEDQPISQLALDEVKRGCDHSISTATVAGTVSR